jgi:hypothetical protein
METLLPGLLKEGNVFPIIRDIIIAIAISIAAMVSATLLPVPRCDPIYIGPIVDRCR